MTIYFSELKNGFLDSDIFGALPSVDIDDAIAVTDQEYSDFRADYLAGKTIEIDSNGELVSVDPIVTLDDAKATKIIEIEREQTRLVESGFVSAALGSDHTYSSDKNSQFNLVGSALAAEDTHYKCADLNGLSEFRLHTAAQIHQVLVDGKNVKLAFMQDAEIKRYHVSVATTIAEIDAIIIST